MKKDVNPQYPQEKLHLMAAYTFSFFNGTNVLIHFPHWKNFRGDQSITNQIFFCKDISHTDQKTHGFISIFFYPCDSLIRVNIFYAARRAKLPALCNGIFLC